MALKLIAQIFVGQHRAKVYRDSEWDEFRVKFYHCAEYLGESCDYHTDDKDDALNTARSEVWRMADFLEVRAALVEFKAKRGRFWRTILGDMWTRGHDVGLLRVARNNLGPDWLNHPHGAAAAV